MHMFKQGDVVMAITHNEYGVTDAKTLFVAIVRKDTLPYHPNPIVREQTLFSTHELSPGYSIFSLYKEGLLSFSDIFALVSVTQDFNLVDELSLLSPFLMQSSIYAHYDRDLFVQNIRESHRQTHGDDIDQFLALMDKITIFRAGAPLPQLRL